MGWRVDWEGYNDWTVKKLKYNYPPPKKNPAYTVQTNDFLKKAFIKI